MGEEYLLLSTCFFVNWVLSLWPSPNHVRMVQNNHILSREGPEHRAIQASIPIPNWNPISSEQDPWNLLDFLLLSALNEFMIYDVLQTWEKDYKLLTRDVFGEKYLLVRGCKAVVYQPLGIKPLETVTFIQKKWIYSLSQEDHVIQSFPWPTTRATVSLSLHQLTPICVSGYPHAARSSAVLWILHLLTVMDGEPWG